MKNVSIWKEVSGFPDYSVSKLGEIKNTKTRLYLNPWVNSQGYLQVTLYRGKKGYKKRVNKLVIEAFQGPCPPGKECNHKDGDKWNNWNGNLEYLTHAENIQHAFRMGLMNPARGKPNAKLNQEKADEIRELLDEGVIQQKIATMYKVSRSAVAKINNNYTWNAEQRD